MTWSYESQVTRHPRRCSRTQQVKNYVTTFGRRLSLMPHVCVCHCSTVKTPALRRTDESAFIRTAGFSFHVKREKRGDIVGFHRQLTND